jgi:hypothetical protein
MKAKYNENEKENQKLKLKMWYMPIRFSIILLDCEDKETGREPKARIE